MVHLMAVGRRCKLVAGSSESRRAIYFHTRALSWRVGRFCPPAEINSSFAYPSNSIWSDLLSVFVSQASKINRRNEYSDGNDVQRAF